ncbi:carboxypeptidase regulatory-like domain-containing protein [Acidaminobacter sp. JC074]|uniref:carboxypeptidase-like regulatory domain-containing protein n=1 Tax=Acidaminobacter sp. JC074 TaxID=2530199 RepID=UPI001F1002C6|nr:carboxypeptidase-like regulatory domain-containing protein [Acidaminobacter sp. JC074]MCH4890317.1 carboxypeptidase regulatory-like domain-containing protein [Acidaminobacter sp. JC074]
MKRVGIIFLIFALLISGMSFGEVSNTESTPQMTVNLIDHEGHPVSTFMVCWLFTDGENGIERTEFAKNADNGEFIIDTSQFKKGLTKTYLVFYSPIQKYMSNSLLVDIHNQDLTENFDLGTVEIQENVLEGSVRVPEGTSNHAELEVLFGDVLYSMSTTGTGNFRVAPIVENWDQPVTLRATYDNVVTTDTNVAYNAKDYVMVLDNVKYSSLTLNVEDVDGSSYNGEVVYNISSKFTSEFGQATVVDGNVDIYLDNVRKEEGFNYIVLAPLDVTKANTKFLDITNVNFDEATVIDEALRLQAPAYSGNIKYDKTTSFENGHIGARFEDGSVVKLPYDAEGTFSLASPNDEIKPTFDLGFAIEQPHNYELYEHITFDEENHQYYLYDDRKTHMKLNLKYADGKYVDNLVKYFLYSDSEVKTDVIVPMNGLVTIDFSKLQSVKEPKYIVFSDLYGDFANTLKVDLSNQDFSEAYFPGEFTIQEATLTGHVEENGAQVQDASVEFRFGDDVFINTLDSEHNFKVAPLVDAWTGNVDIKATANDKFGTARVAHDSKDVTVILDQDVPKPDMLTATVHNPSGQVYNGVVCFAVETETGIKTQMILSDNGQINVEVDSIEKGNDYTYVTIFPENTSIANSIPKNATNWDLSQSLTISEAFTLQGANARGVLKDEHNNGALGHIVIEYQDGRIFRVPTNVNGEFAVSHLNNGIIKMYGVDTVNNKKSAVQEVTVDTDNLVFEANQLLVEPASEIKRVELDVIKDGEGIEGIYTLSDQDTLAFALPEKIEGTIKVTAFDQNDDPIEVENITLDMSTDFGKVPTLSSDTLTTYEVAGGYGDQYFGKLILDGNEFDIEMLIYQGKLGLATIENSSGKALSGRLAYDINYQVSNGGQKGSTTNGKAYNGILPIPIQNDFVNIDYGYVLVSPEEMLDGSHYANSIVADITNSMRDNGSEFFDLGTIKLQDPVLKIEVTDKNGDPWRNATANMNVNYSGTMSGLQLARIVVRNVDGFIALANFGPGFETVLDIDIEEFGPISNYPVYLTNVDITEKTTIQAASDNVKLFIKGDILLPNGDSIPAGQGRDTSLVVRGIGNNNHHYESYWFNTVEYGVPALEVGKEYEILVRFDVGDFNDKKITDTLPITVLVGNTPEEMVVKDHNGDIIQLTSEDIDDDSIVYDFKATNPVIRGHVKAGDEFVKNLDVSIYSLEGEKIASSMVHNATTPNKPIDEGVFMIGGIEALTGEYKLVVDAPEDTIDYTGFEKIMTFPVTEEVTLELPETKIKGNIIVSDSDKDEFNDRYRRVYVNVFDEYGRYLTNGQVKSNGQFAMGQLDSGRYYAEAYVSPYADLASKYISSERIFFNVMGNNDETFNVPLREKAATCVVLDTDNHSVQDAWVMIYDEAYNEVTSVKSNEQGQFAIPVLADGKYFIKALAASNLSDSSTYDITFSNGKYTGPSAVWLTKSQVIGSTYAGQTLVDAQVLVFNEQKQFVAFSKTTDNQPYQIGGLKDGTYYLQAIPKNPIDGYTQSDLIRVEITSGEFVMDLHFKEVGLTGNVVGPENQMINDGWVHLYIGDEIVASSMIIDGTYKFGELDSNKTYTVIADGTNTPYHASSKELVEGNTVNLKLSSSASIKGKLVLNSEVVEGEVVYLYDGGKSPLVSVRTNAFGEFNFDGLAEGDYMVVIKTRSGEALVEDINYSGTEVNLGTKDIK